MAPVGKVASQAMAAGQALGEVDLGTASLLGGEEEPLLDHMGEMYFREQNVFAKCPGFRQFETFELSQGGESNSVTSGGGPIEEKDILAWAYQPAATGEGEPFRLKMLIGKMIDYKNKSSCESSGDDVQRSRRVLKNAISGLGLSSAVLDSYFKGFANFSPLPASSSPRDLIYCLDIVSGAFTICWRYFPEDNCATALLLYNEKDCEQMLGDLKTYLRAQARHIEKPLLLGYIGTVIRFRQTWWQLEQIKEALRQAEQESDYTFLGEQHQHQPNQMQLDSTAKDGMDLGYIVMVNKQMAGVSINAARRLKQMQDDCQLMLDYEPCPELRNWFRCLIQHIRSRVLFAEASRERATVQIQELTNLIDRQEQSLAIEIAELSRRDNYSVKTLAILGMVFLPGTFVSSLFDSSLFNWTPPTGQSVLTPGFWIYMKFTIPFTLMITLVWWIALFFFTKRNASQRPHLDRRIRHSNGRLLAPDQRPRRDSMMAVHWDDDARESDSKSKDNDDKPGLGLRTDTASSHWSGITLV